MKDVNHSLVTLSVVEVEGSEAELGGRGRRLVDVQAPADFDDPAVGGGDLTVVECAVRPRHLDAPVLGQVVSQFLQLLGLVRLALRVNRCLDLFLSRRLYFGATGQ